MRTTINKLPIFIVGVISAVGFAPLFWWPITIAGLYLLFKRLFYNNQLSPQAIFIQSWLFGLGFSCASLWWVGGSFRFTPYGMWGLTIAPFAVLGLSAIMAILIAIPVVSAGYIRKWIPAAMFPLTIALFWVGGEWLRGLTIYGFPWHLLGYTLAGNLPLMQSASLGGVWLLSIMVILPATVLALQPNRKLIAIHLIPIIMLIGWGWQRIHNVQALPIQNTAIIIQPNIPQDLKWSGNPALQTREILDMIDKFSKPNHLVVLPETAITFIKEDIPNIETIIADRLKVDSTLVTGIPSRRDGKYYNSMLSINSNAELVGLYDKKKLVPFGEFVPLRELMPSFIQNMTQGGEYSRGKSPNNLNTSFGNVLPLICYEAIFPQNIIKTAITMQPKFMINITNDGWFDNTSGPYQHFAIARVRSVETGLGQIRAANTGISAIIDGYGRVLNRIKIKHSYYIDGIIPIQIDTVFRRLQ